MGSKQMKNEAALVNRIRTGIHGILSDLCINVWMSWKKR
jgi:hypothetical protein